MTPNLVPGVFKIVSLTEGNPPTSVSLNLLPRQTVHLNGQVTHWVVRKEEGRSTYRLCLGGYPFTGVIHDKVTASIHEEQNLEWRATYREHQGAYTIEQIDDQNKGWTVADHSANSEIVIEPITFLPGVPHGNYAARQLFRFVPIPK